MTYTETATDTIYTDGPDGTEYTEAEVAAALACDCGYRDGCGDCHDVLVAAGVLSPASGPRVELEVAPLPSYADGAVQARQDISGLMSQLAANFDRVAA